MKKNIFIMILLLLTLCSCNDNNEEKPEEPPIIETQKYKIEFVSEFGELPSTLEQMEKYPDTLPELSYEGYNFLGWYLDSNFNNIVDLTDELTSNVILYAKWEKITYDFRNYASETKKLLSVSGFAEGEITDFSIYENTEMYRVVNTPAELAKALYDAKYNYTNTWENDTVVQTLEKEGTVRVIEIASDMNLGFNVIDSEAKSNGIITDYKTSGALSNMVKENGISQIKVENISNLLIYSKNGVKLTHAGFKVTSCHNVVFRNIAMDEIWEWEDSNDASVSKIGDYDKFGWAYFKISHCGHIWIDHMSFGKSYDGQIDYANPVSNSPSTKIRLAYGSDGSNGLHISYCNFNVFSSDKDGYIYNMMSDIENEYQQGLNNYLYYNALRNAGLTFEQIFYGLAVPQKKGFLLGDNASNNDDFHYNEKMQVSFNSCKIINFCDRIPKIRGGQCVFYNCLIDSSEYYSYRNTVKSLGGSAVTKVNSSWKCACVSQGILVSYGGYIHLENTVIKGIEELLKNNDSKTNPFVTNVGYYNIINCSYQLSADKKIFTGSTTDKNIPACFNRNLANLKIASSVWPYYNNLVPFDMALIDLEDVINNLDNNEYGSGVKQDVTSWLFCNL